MIIFLDGFRRAEVVRISRPSFHSFQDSQEADGFRSCFNLCHFWEAPTNLALLLSYVLTQETELYNDHVKLGLVYFNKTV